MFCSGPSIASYNLSRDTDEDLNDGIGTAEGLQYDRSDGRGNQAFRDDIETLHQSVSDLK